MIYSSKFGEDWQKMEGGVCGQQNTIFWGAEGAPILFSDLGLRMASCSYIYIYIYFCHFANGGAHVVLYKALNPL